LADTPESETPIQVFGTHDEGTLAQMRDVASRAERAALMADGHVGYVQPIGGVVAYDEKVSVVGVGFDIACLAEGTPVTTASGFWRPIEAVAGADPVTCWDGARVRLVAPHAGAIYRGRRQTVRATLRNGRRMDATRDHQVMTPRGWRRLDALAPAERIACSPHVGLPYEPPPADIELGPVAPRDADVLAERALWPLRGDSRRLPALLRVLGYVSGDGHLAKNGTRVSIFTTSEQDAADLVGDFRELGFTPHVHRRSRNPRDRDEHHVYVGSRALHALLGAMGSPVGRKEWLPAPMTWLFGMPAWVRAHFLSAFCSAEMMTPRVHPNGTVPNLQVKQAGSTTHAIDFLARLFRSLDFDVSVAPSGPPRGERRDFVLQIHGGASAQMRFLRDVGFCRAICKREQAAVVASVAWAGSHLTAVRDAAKAEARALKHAGGNWKSIMESVAARDDVPRGFANHSIYDRRGSSRRLPGDATSAAVSGEVCWVALDRLEGGPVRDVYDVVTGDPARAYFGAGTVVHNCGNCAIRTDLTPERVGGAERWKQIANDIEHTISFGIGRKNEADDAPVDHPLFESEKWYAVPANERGRLKTKARQQLGTVGSGNHYVDVFADDEGAVWVGVHFGSRGLGHTIASAFLALGQNRNWGDRAPEQEVLLPLDAPIGHDYWQLMTLAGEYAYAGREWVARKVVELLGGREVDLVHNHHNFAWREEHEGRVLAVVRKGATPAFPGQRGFVGGSMGDDAVIVAGAVTEDSDVAELQRAALYSTIHGAGRVMSRTEAAGKRNRKTGEVKRPGRITPEMMRDWIGQKGVILRGGGLDESPHVYRRLPDVLAAQEGTITVERTLRPLLVVMAGANEFDPYKD